MIRDQTLCQQPLGSLDHNIQSKLRGRLEFLLLASLAHLAFYPLTDDTQINMPISYLLEFSYAFSVENRYLITPNVMNVTASNYMSDRMDNINFNIENYQASKKKKVERME
jgi:hypothetical protein